MARSGGRWRDLPERLGDFQTVKRRYYRWIEMGVLDPVVRSPGDGGRPGVGRPRLHLDPRPEQDGFRWNRPKAESCPGPSRWTETSCNWPLRTGSRVQARSGGKGKAEDPERAAHRARERRAEQALRGIAPGRRNGGRRNWGRRNWTFAGSGGVDRTANMLTLITAARLNDIDPRAWLAAGVGWPTLVEPACQDVATSYTLAARIQMTLRRQQATSARESSRRRRRPEWGCPIQG
jgi:hypothetical protein